MRSTHTKNMKKMHINAENLDREFAFIKGNRPTNNRSVNTKMKSIEELWVAFSHYGGRR